MNSLTIKTALSLLQPTIDISYGKVTIYFYSATPHPKGQAKAVVSLPLGLALGEPKKARPNISTVFESIINPKMPKFLFQCLPCQSHYFELFPYRTNY